MKTVKQLLEGVNSQQRKSLDWLKSKWKDEDAEFNITEDSFDWNIKVLSILKDAGEINYRTIDGKHYVSFDK